MKLLFQKKLVLIYKKWYSSWYERGKNSNKKGLVIVGKKIVAEIKAYEILG